MKVLLRIDVEKDDRQKLHNIIDRIFNTENNSSNKTADQITIQVRDEIEPTKKHSDELKKLEFKYYAKSHGKDDPHWTLRCIPSYWNSIKDKPVFEKLNIWSSADGES